MSNRTLPYGYCYKNGIIAIESKESKVLKRIFSAYLNGDSMLTIAEQLNREKIEYASGVIGWNKGRLKHLIDNPRYLGTEVYPQKIHATDSGRSTEGGAGNRTDHIGQGEHQKPLSSLACCSILPSFHEARGTTQQL